jgi:predicted lipid-binding transport protein (Tim44 family)
MPAPANLSPRSLAAVAATEAGPGIGRGPAQQLARRELARAMYQPSIEDRIGHWLGTQLARIFNLLNGALPGGWLAVMCLLVALILAAALIVIQIRPAAARRRTSSALHTAESLSARDHRELSRRSAAQSDYSAAIVELVRAIAIGLEERDVLPANPGRTAAELAAEAGQAMPAQASQLIDAARLFDDVMYGGRTGSAASYQWLRDLDIRLQSLRPPRVSASMPAAAGGAG